MAKVQKVKINYPYLPKGKKINYVNANNVFMRAAKKACKELSTEHNHPTGAVVVLSGKIVGRGGNQAALKSQKLRDFHKNTLCIRRLLKVKTGEKYWLCPGCASLKMHGERQAINDAKNRVNDLTGADVYLWGHWWACEACWNDIMGNGIVNLYLLEGSEILFNRDHSKNVIGEQLTKT